MASIYFPPMVVTREGLGAFMTTREPSTLTDDDGTEYQFSIPPTAVRWIFPHQVVDACQGTGAGVILSLPKEPVEWGVAQEVPVTGSLNGRAFTGTLPKAKTTWHGPGKFVAEAVTMTITFNLSKGTIAVSTTHEETLVKTLNAPSVGDVVKKAAGALGIGILQLGVWLLQNPSAQATLLTDLGSGNFTQAVEDLIADYNAANNPTPAPTPAT